MFSWYYFQTHSSTVCHRATVCWDIPPVWRRGPETQMGLQWNSAKTTREATLTEVRHITGSDDDAEMLEDV